MAGTPGVEWQGVCFALSEPVYGDPAPKLPGSGHSGITSICGGASRGRQRICLQFFRSTSSEKPQNDISTAEE